MGDVGGARTEQESGRTGVVRGQPTRVAPAVDSAFDLRKFRMNVESRVASAEDAHAF